MEPGVQQIEVVLDQWRPQRNQRWLWATLPGPDVKVDPTDRGGARELEGVSRESVNLTGYPGWTWQWAQALRWRWPPAVAPGQSCWQDLAPWVEAALTRRLRHQGQVHVEDLLCILILSGAGREMTAGDGGYLGESELVSIFTFSEAADVCST